MNSKELLDEYRAGEDAAANAIFDRYVARMIALARRRIAPKLTRRIDADDVVQSAFRSFFVHAKDDDYQLAHSGDLWRLLASITLHKLHRQVERQTAAKRSVHREVSTNESNQRSITNEPSAAEAAALVDELQFVINHLTSDERLVLTSTLQGQDIDEIGRAMGKSERTARRLLAEVKQKLEHRLFGQERNESERTSSLVLPPAPLRYADYLLEQLIGSGGMGKVYRATEKSTGIKVAIKALHKSRQTDPRAVAQFVQEAEILARLQHPNIVGVKGLGQFPGGGYFIVMDFIDGVDLQSRIKQGPLRLRHAVEIVVKVAGAIQYGHEQGVVHCDLKPANILIDKEGRVFVTDFGFAFMIARTATARAAIGGTAGYIAPEILLRKSTPTPAADVYALGMLLWTLVTAKPPGDFDLETNGLPEAIRQICIHCVAIDPKERYKSPSEFAMELGRHSSFSASIHDD